MNVLTVFFWFLTNNSGLWKQGGKKKSYNQCTARGLLGSCKYITWVVEKYMSLLH